MSGSAKLKKRLAESRLAPAAVFPGRAKLVAKHNAAEVRESARWLVRSREHTNFTYDLTPRNREHLAWWVSAVSGVDVADARGYIRELDEDADLRSHIETGTANSPRRRVANSEVLYGRRAGWYALTRALRPAHVMETGTDKGLGTCVFAAAILRNGEGRLTTLDINPNSGYLLTGKYAEVTERLIGDSVAQIRAGSEPVDLFIHDSWHSYEHELAEFEAVAPRLAEPALVLSDNAEVTDALVDWSNARGRRFLYFGEEPVDHWFPGGGIGASY